MVVYLDGFMGLNFLVDWMLLLGVNRLAGFPPGAGRTAAAAAVGGGYAGMCLIPGLGFLAGTLWRGVSLGLISVTAFGLSASALRRGLLFVLLSMALGGLALCADAGCVTGLLLCCGGMLWLCSVGVRGNALNRRLKKLEIRHRGRTIHLLALCDTGNHLRDPLTGEPVLVVDRDSACRLLGISAEELRDVPQTLLAHPELGLRLIRYGTVGNGGMLPACRCEQVSLDGKRTGGLVAFSPESFGNGEYGALTGGYYG